MPAEIHRGSSKAYRMKLSPLEQKILMNIQLGIVLFDRFSHPWSHILFIVLSYEHSRHYIHKLQPYQSTQC